MYGSAKAGLDAFARGFADLLHGTGVRVVLVRPGFVTGRMTAGMPPAPLATTPEAVGAGHRRRAAPRPGHRLGPARPGRLARRAQPGPDRPSGAVSPADLSLTHPR